MAYLQQAEPTRTMHVMEGGRGALACKQPDCLLYGAKDTQHNQAIVLCELLLAAK
jgi:uncharacterized protein YeaO (DUF488 family)